MSRERDDLDVRLGGVEAVRLVAARELRTRLASKAYRIVTASLVVMVVAFAVVMGLVRSHPTVVDVGVTGGARPLAPLVVSTARTAGLDVHVQVVADPAAARAKVTGGDLDAAVVGTQGTDLQVLVDRKLGDNLRGTLTAVARSAALDRRIAALGGDPRAVETAVSRAALRVTALHPSQRFDPERLAVGSVAGILIYLALISTGQGVAQGVVEEKSSRVVELLLAAVRPWQLMAGKVLGIGLVGLLQVALVGIAGIVAGRLTGSLTLSLAAGAGVVAWLVVWFVLGFTLFSLVFAALGALVSRQEDVAGVTTPAIMLLVVGYVVGISVLPSSPDNTVVALMSLLPVFSPTLMPMRLAMGAVPLWQLLVSLALAVATIPFLVVVAGRVYRNGVVRTGARVRLREALARG